MSKRFEDDPEVPAKCPPVLPTPPKRSRKAQFSYEDYMEEQDYLDSLHHVTKDRNEQCYEADLQPERINAMGFAIRGHFVPKDDTEVIYSEPCVETQVSPEDISKVDPADKVLMAKEPQDTRYHVPIFIKIAGTDIRKTYLFKKVYTAYDADVSHYTSSVGMARLPMQQPMLITSCKELPLWATMVDSVPHFNNRLDVFPALRLTHPVSNQRFFLHPVSGDKGQFKKGQMVIFERSAWSDDYKAITAKDFNEYLQFEDIEEVHA